MMFATNSARPDPPPTFMTIPREMRNRIYYFMFAGVEVTVPRLSKRMARAGCYTSRQLSIATTEQPGAVRKVYGSHGSGIFQACRQIHAEALEAYFKFCTFTGGPEDIIAWVRKLSTSSRTSLREVRLDVGIAFDWLGNDLRLATLEHVQVQALLLNIPPGVLKACFFDSEGEVVWASELPPGCSISAGLEDQRSSERR